ncbi:MAG: hypothetical protein K2Q26_01840 [Bdellovibrionales bacterium]|nr:hypothetical protein [Bdellovibrionales bacterium]
MFKKEEQIVTNYVPQSVKDERAEVKKVEFIDFVENARKDSFDLDPRISEQIGLNAVKEKEQQRRFDLEVMKYVQKIKDDAYSQAYEKGYAEGVQKGKDETIGAAEGELKETFKTLKKWMSELEDLRAQGYAENEKEIIHFSYFVAEKILMREIEKDPEFVVPLIKTVLAGDSSKKNDVKAYVSRRDFDFLTNIIQKPEYTDIGAIKLEAKDELQPGDVVIETPQGTIDGTLKQRLQRMKSLINDNTQYED